MDITGELQRRIDAYDSEAQRHRDAALQAGAKRDAYKELLQWAAEQGENGGGADDGQQRKAPGVSKRGAPFDTIGAGDSSERDNDEGAEL